MPAKRPRELAVDLSNQCVALDGIDVADDGEGIVDLLDLASDLRGEQACTLGSTGSDRHAHVVALHGLAEQPEA